MVYVVQPDTPLGDLGLPPSRKSARRRVKTTHAKRRSITAAINKNTQKYLVRVWREMKMQSGYVGAIAKDTFYGEHGNKIGTTLILATGVGLLFIAPPAGIAAITNPVALGSIGVAGAKIGENLLNSLVPTIKKRFQLRKRALRMTEHELAALERAEDYEAKALRRERQAAKKLHAARRAASLVWEKRFSLKREYRKGLKPA